MRKLLTLLAAAFLLIGTAAAVGAHPEDPGHHAGENCVLLSEAGIPVGFGVLEFVGDDEFVEVDDVDEHGHRSGYECAPVEVDPEPGEPEDVGDDPDVDPVDEPPPATPVEVEPDFTG